MVRRAYETSIGPIMPCSRKKPSMDGLRSKTLANEEMLADPTFDHVRRSRSGRLPRKRFRAYASYPPVSADGALSDQRLIRLDGSTARSRLGFNLRCRAAIAVNVPDTKQLLIVPADGNAVIGCLQITFIRGVARLEMVRMQIESVRVASDVAAVASVTR